MMQLAERSSDVRNHFSEFLDTVIRDRPGFISRNRDVLLTFNKEHLAVMLESLCFHAEFKPDAGDIVGTLAEIDNIVVSGATKDEALVELAKDLVEYAEEYLTRSFKLYFNAPNRRKHFPYMIKIAMQPDLQAVMNLLVHDESAGSQEIL